MPESVPLSTTAFAAVLRRQRAESGMSQEALAEAAGLHVNHVSFLERAMRTPSLDVVLRLAGGLGVRGVDLVGSTETEMTAHRSRNEAR